MRQLQRSILDDQRPSGNPEAGEGSELAEIRSEGLRHLTVGSDAIKNALSGDKLSFLRATRQQGGE